MTEYSNYRKPASHHNPYHSHRDYYKDNLRVLKKNLLFTSGVPIDLTEDQLKSNQYFGKYGTVLKVTLLRNVRQMSVYVTYADPWEASLAIIATNDFELDRYHKLASIYGTIKYCKYFMKKIECKNLPNCNYLHVYDKKNQIYINNQLPDEVFDEHYNIALDLLREGDVQKMIREKGLVANNEKNGDVLPCPIEALNRIVKGNGLRWQENESENESDRSEQSEQRSKQNEEQESSKSSKSEKSDKCSDKSQQKSIRSLSEKETRQTVGSESKQQGGLNNEEFPRIESIIHSDRKEKPKEQQCVNKYMAQGCKIRNFNSGSNILSVGNVSNVGSSGNESMEIKVIRKILRESRSKLGVWTEGNRSQEEEVKLFHKELDQLNELREMCEWEVIKQANKQEERVGFLIIKNIHHTPIINTNNNATNATNNNPKNYLIPSSKTNKNNLKYDPHYT